MPRFHNVDGVRVAFTTQEEIDRDADEAGEAAAASYAASPQGQEDQVQADIEAEIGTNAPDTRRALIRAMADVLRVANPALSIAEARTAVRNDYQRNLRVLRGL